MHEVLIKYIRERSQTPLTADDIALIERAFILKRYKKRQFLLHEGKICKSLFFIIKGAIRQYSVDDKGGEQILNLGIENWWTGDRESFHKEVPSIYNIDAWEDTEALLLSKFYYYDINAIAAFTEMRIMLDDNQHFANQRRLKMAISHTADERYDDFIKSNPLFAQRFPQHIIASYLGVTKETLSRIRGGKIIKK